MPQLSTYDDHGPVSLPDIHIFQMGVNPHTLRTDIFIKEILRNEIFIKEILSCHTRLVLLISGQCVGVNPHTLHTKKFIKEILNKIPKKHKLSCHKRLVLLIPTPVCGVKPAYSAYQNI